jgi:hypothetical protein
MRRIKIICTIVLFLLIFPVLGFGQEEVAELFVILTVPLEAESEFTDDAVQLFDAMNAEMTWLGVNSEMFTIAVSRGMTEPPPPSRDNLSAEDLAADPRYIITGGIFEDDGMRIFEIYIWKMEDSSLMGSQELAYNTVDEALGFIPFFMWTLYSTLPADKRVVEEDIRWKNKWFYLGLRAGGGPRFYLPVDSGPQGVALVYDAGFRIETQFLSHIAPKRFFSLSFQTGLDITIDWSAYSNADFGWLTDDPFDINIDYREKVFEFRSMSRVVPALIKVNFKPGIFALAPYGGIYYSLPFYKDWNGEMESEGLPFGIIAGFSAGRKLGPGVVSLDLSYGFDLGATRVTREDLDYVGEIKYWRHRLSITAGYDFGFRDRKIRIKAEEN